MGTMAETCQEYLKSNNQKVLSMHEQMLLRTGGDAPAEEEDDDDEDDDEPNVEEEWKGLAEKDIVPEKDRITMDTFAVWKVKFDAEMIEKGVLKKEEQRGKTGKLIFLDIKESEKDAGKDSGKDGAVVYNAALFGEA